MWNQMLTYFREDMNSYLEAVYKHMFISSIALIIAILIAIPFGVISVKYKKHQQAVTNLFGALRLIPSLAILILFIPIFGTGLKPALVALTLLAIPPILMNTVAGLEDVPDFVIETAFSCGMTSSQVWRKIRLPLIDERIDELLLLVGLSPKDYKNRYPKQLSGGQQQRVGLARALAVDPKIMLLDEPFGAIDSINRLNLQDELLQIHGGLKKTFLFVTHDIEEAFKMGTRIMIMNEGRIIQFDTPEHIIKHPADKFVSSLIASAREKGRFWEKYHD